MRQVVVRGARQHTLQDVDLDIPLDQLVVFVGRSGSGKSSMAFDTVHAEGQRRYLEALATRLRDAVGALPRPDVDVVQHLPPTVALPQHQSPPGSHSTVGTMSEVDTLLRVLWGRAGVQHCPVSGEVVQTTAHDHIVEAFASLPEGSRLYVEAPVRVRGDAGPLLADIARAGFSRVRVAEEVVRLEEVSAEHIGDGDWVHIVIDRVKVAPDRRDRLHDAVRTASRAGIGRVVGVTGDQTLAFTDRPFSFATGEVLPDLSPALFRAPGAHACEACAGLGVADGCPCAACEGTGLGPVARAVTFGGTTLPALAQRPVGEVAEAVASWTPDALTEPLIREITLRLEALVQGGLGHVTLQRRSASLSTGELQRLRLARQVGAELSGVLFVLDEPTTGLGRTQVAGLLAMLRRMVARGNSLLVVEHHPDVIRAADWVVEFGPGPGRLGGQVIFQGPPAALEAAPTPTGAWLRDGAQLTWATHAPTAWLDLQGASGANLVGDAVRVAVGGLTALVGPSGSGKTALMASLHGHLAARWSEAEAPAGTLVGGPALQRVLDVDAASARRSRRSMPATYIGLWDVLRELFAATTEAQVRGMQARTFSLHVPAGRCEGCAGLGVRRIDLQVLPDVDVPCDVCDGRRFASDVLQVRWKGLSAADVLDLSSDEALPILAGHPRLEEALRAMRDVGLGYLPLGQPAHTLSGGEARRLKLARELVRAAKRGAADVVFLLDEPTAGLHPADVGTLYRLLRRLVDEGATVVVATHHAELAAAADHVVHLGPGVGAAGGRVVAQGPPGAVSVP